MKTLLKKLAPAWCWRILRALNHQASRNLRRAFESVGLNVARRSDYYSPLPVESELARNEARWNRPSALVGVRHDLPQLKKDFASLCADYLDEFKALPPYSQNATAGIGPGYPELDAMLLYMMVRKHRPAFYLEVGSGLSTYYCSLAARENGRAASPLRIQCIEPFPYPALHSIAGIQLREGIAQDTGLDVFLALEANDVLFIDSSHAVKIDGEVPFLILEVLPRLKKGVLIHIHDIPFPYNIPYPAEHWVLGRSPTAPHWPAMLVQAFLAFNTDFEILMSLPLLRHHEEPFLAATVSFYKPVTDQADTFSSLWLRKVS
jgi:hypothetical protein